MCMLTPFPPLVHLHYATDHPERYADSECYQYQLRLRHRGHCCGGNPHRYPSGDCHPGGEAERQTNVRKIYHTLSIRTSYSVVPHEFFHGIVHFHCMLWLD